MSAASNAPVSGSPIVAFRSSGVTGLWVRSSCFRTTRCSLLGLCRAQSRAATSVRTRGNLASIAHVSCPARQSSSLNLGSFAQKPTACEGALVGRLGSFVVFFGGVALVDTQCNGRENPAGTDRKRLAILLYMMSKGLADFSGCCFGIGTERSRHAARPFSRPRTG